MTSTPSGEAHPGKDVTAADPALPSVTSHRRVFLLAGIGAVALILAGAAAWLLRTAPPARRPQAPRAGSVPGTGGLSPGPGSVVPAEAIIFRWTPVPGADRYEISVIDVEGAVLAHLTVPGKEFTARWPKDRPLPRPGHLIWRIEAFSTHSVITEGRPIPFQVR